MVLTRGTHIKKRVKIQCLHVFAETASTLTWMKYTFSHYYLLYPTLFAITITTNTDQAVLAAWEHSVSVYSISPDVGFLSTIDKRLLAKWTAVTMTRAQQTHDIFTVYCVRRMAVLLEWLTGIFSHGYPVLVSQLLGLCNWDSKTIKLRRFCLFWAFSLHLYSTSLPKWRQSKLCQEGNK